MMPPSSWAHTTRTRSTRAIRSSIWIRSALASWSRWLPTMAARPTRTWVWASAASTAAIPAVSSSATTLAWTTSAALPTVFPSPAWPPHRQQLKIHALKSRRFLQLNVDYDKARSYRNSRGCVLWPKQWKDLTVKVAL